MSYLRPLISSSPPPYYLSDSFITSSYQPLYAYEPRLQMAGQQVPQTITTQVPQTITTQVPQQVIQPAPQPVIQPVIQPVMQPAPQPVMQPAQPVGQNPIVLPIQIAPPSKQPQSGFKGFTIVNIILILLILSSCIACLTTILNGNIIGALVGVCCLCIMSSIYTYYNSQPSVPNN